MGRFENFGKDALARVDELVGLARFDEVMKKRDDAKFKKTVCTVLIVVAAVLAVAGIAFALYKFFTPEYLEDFEEDFEDDFDDEYFEEEDDFE